MTNNLERLPVIAVVGRPNVGKSTLVNRFVGRRAAVVEDIPGVTRDRVSYDAEWNGRSFLVQDTGGWEPDATGIGLSIAQQAELAMSTADVILLVVDTHTGATGVDEALAKSLRRSPKPVFLIANKSDNPQNEDESSGFWSLGLGRPYPVSALHGKGAADVLDAALLAVPTILPAQDEASRPRRVALVGRPNVGKSSLINKLSGETRSVVDSVAGTTVDPVDSVIFLDEEDWHFVDTAGLRRKVSHASGHEFYAAVRTKSAIEAAEVVIVLIDASVPLTEQDQRVFGMVGDAGRAMILACNKWDLVDDDRRVQLEKELDRGLTRVTWAPRVNISALSGRSIHKLAPALRIALESWEKRIPTGELNHWFAEVTQATPPPPRGGRIPRLLYVTQATTQPPTFVLFTTGFLEAGYRRFLERKLRETFGFDGSPIQINVREREKRGPKPKRS